MLRGRTPTAHELFHLATRGNAVNLGLDEDIGTLDPGRWADLVVLDPAATPVLEARHALSANLEDALFALAVLGDDRAVRATHVVGRRMWGGVLPRRSEKCGWWTGPRHFMLRTRTDIEEPASSTSGPTEDSRDDGQHRRSV